MFHVSSAQNQTYQPLTWQDIAALPIPTPDHTIKYGTDSLQFGELRLPKQGKGPFPVVVVVHGGCWLSAYNLNYMSHVSAALTEAGYATWNIEFRRVGDTGGGWPGTFQDVALATDFVRELAKKHPVDAKNVAVIGHSAGGHLALWLANREHISASSPLYTKKPLKLKGAIALAGIPDLATYGTQQGSCNEAVPQLMGGTAAEYPERYAQVSPHQMRLGAVPSRLVQGAKDPIVPVSQAENFAKKATAASADSDVILLPEAGHFDLVAPQAPFWPQILQTVTSVF
ncbi:alpha/beta hydrolase [Pontibacter oryzae]|uniref:Alpha/beta hydrolase n=2 Tax=Pontibacter oryzae TaxID=2304593 RepID=A0A399SJR8_9BACT|nr:alpha/beta hydrolase [Pontibacter oryzae]